MWMKKLVYQVGSETCADVFDTAQVTGLATRSQRLITSPLRSSMRMLPSDTRSCDASGVIHTFNGNGGWFSNRSRQPRSCCGSIALLSSSTAFVSCIIPHAPAPGFTFISSTRRLRVRPLGYGSHSQLASYASGSACPILLGGFRFLRRL